MIGVQAIKNQTCLAWNAPEQCNIDKWRGRLRACTRANVGQFDQPL